MGVGNGGRDSAHDCLCGGATPPLSVGRPSMLASIRPAFACLHQPSPMLLGRNFASVPPEDRGRATRATKHCACRLCDVSVINAAEPLASTGERSGGGAENLMKGARLRDCG
jgi:hypothetical protein